MKKRRRHGPRLPRLTVMAWSAKDLARLTDAAETMIASVRDLDARVIRLKHQCEEMQQMIAQQQALVSQLLECYNRQPRRAAKAKPSANGTPTAAAPAGVCCDGTPILDIATEGGAA